MGRVVRAAIVTVAAAAAACGGVDESAAEPSPAAEEAEPGRVIVEVTGFRNREGDLRLALYTSAEGFPDREGAQLTGVTPIDDDGGVTHTFSPVPPGTFAVGVLHDENRNEKMDKNFFGIPQEGYGISNNPEPKLRAPTFEEARLELEPGETVNITINLVYR